MGLAFDDKLSTLLTTMFEQDDPLVGLRKDAARRAASLVGVELDGNDLDEGLARYVDKVSQEPYKVIDEDIDALREAGLSKEQIFDLTTGAAVGASLARLRLARAVIRGGEA